MPRLVKYAFSRSSRSGPPATPGRRAPRPRTAEAPPRGTVASGLAGGYTQACTSWPNFPSNSSLRALGRYPDAGRRARPANRASSPSRWSCRPGSPTAAWLGPPATSTTDMPSADSPGAKIRYGMSRSVSSPVPRVEHAQPQPAAAVQHREPAVGQHRVRALPELPQRARRTPPRPGRPPQRARRPGSAGRGSTSPASRRSGTGSCRRARPGPERTHPMPPLTSPPLPGTPSSTGATRSSVPSHGIRGWFQHTQARRRPSGEGVGNA